MLSTSDAVMVDSLVFLNPTETYMYALQFANLLIPLFQPKIKEITVPHKGKRKNALTFKCEIYLQ